MVLLRNILQRLLEVNNRMIERIVIGFEKENCMYGCRYCDRGRIRSVDDYNRRFNIRDLGYGLLHGLERTRRNKNPWPD